MNQNEWAISVSELKKSYKGVQVLQGVSFTVKRGSIFALLGSNGAGKTTIVRILSTLLKPCEGAVVVNGYSVETDAHKVRAQISLTGQYAAVDEMLTGRENLRMIGALRHLTGIKKQAEELLGRFSLLDAADRRVATYSGGMRRKLDLAMSLMGKPSIIFLDEPTTGLDPQSRISMWKTIQSLTETGATVFLTTQYLEEAERLADWIAILDKGVIIAEGTAEDLKRILPGGVIELSFQREGDLQTAVQALQSYDLRVNNEQQILTVTTGEGITQLTDILNILKDADITVSRFEQKLPTLEDVFLTLISGSEKKEENCHD